MTKILVVDDENQFLEITVNMLEGMGYFANSAINMQEARDKLQKDDFDLIISDVYMPNSSGFDLLNYVKNYYPDTFVLMVSGQANPELAKKAFDLGACGYLSKPLRQDELQINIIHALKMRQLYRENRSYQEGLESLVQARTRELEHTVANLNKTKNELHKQLKFQETLMEVIPSPVFYKNRAGFFMGCNQAFENFLGKTRDQIIGKTVFELSPENDAQKYQQMDEELLQKAGSQTYEYQVQPAEGQIRQVVFNKSALIDEQGDAFGLLGIITDITRQKEIEKSLRENQDWLQSVFNGLQAGIIIVDGVSLKVVDANQMALELLGREKKDLVGQDADSYIIGKHIAGRMRNNSIVSEAEIMNSSGQKIPVQKNLVAVNLHGKSHLLECFIDIRDQKQAQDRLQKTKKEIQQVLEAISSALISINKQRKVFRWNRFAEEIFAQSSEDAIGKTLKELRLSWKWEEIDKGLQDCEQKKRQISLLDIPYTRTDKRSGFLNINIYPLKDDQDKYSGCLLLCEEITEKRILEGQLQQSQKLDAIGQLAAGIAHEINTPTQYVGDNIRFLQDAFEDLKDLIQSYEQVQDNLQKGEPWSETIEEIKELSEDIDLEFLKQEIPTAIAQSLDGVNRVAEIVSSMKRFSHPGNKEKSAVDINDSLRNTITISRNEWKYIADVQTDLKEDLPAVMGFTGELNQVFLNLILNAAQAIGEQKDKQEQGKITISSKKDDDYVRIEVADNGPGIAPELQEKIFEHFFTTKEVGKGTGQGLSLAYNTIVENHGGMLTVQSQPEQGATFIVKLPSVKS